jgi:hypothetical protein
VTPAGRREQRKRREHGAGHDYDPVIPFLRIASILFLMQPAVCRADYIQERGPIVISGNIPVAVLLWKVEYPNG